MNYTIVVLILLQACRSWNSWLNCKLYRDHETILCFYLKQIQVYKLLHVFCESRVRMLASKYKMYLCNQIHVISQSNNLVKWQCGHHCNMTGHGQSHSIEQMIFAKWSRSRIVCYSSNFLKNRKCWLLEQSIKIKKKCCATTTLH